MDFLSKAGIRKDKQFEFLSDTESVYNTFFNLCCDGTVGKNKIGQKIHCGMASKIAENESTREEWKEYLKSWITQRMLIIPLRRNLDIIKKYYESEIEKVFLSAIVTESLVHGPVFLTLFASVEDMENEIIYLNKSRPKMFKKLCGLINKRGSEVEQEYRKNLWWKANYYYALFPEVFEHLNGEYLDYAFVLAGAEGFNLDETYRINIQSTIKNGARSGKGIRPDAIIWKLNRNTKKYALECDGYQYHSEKKRFEADTIRNRDLRNLGYDVIRFSGTEIFKDPTGVANEFLDILVKENSKAPLKYSGGLSSKLKQGE